MCIRDRAYRAKPDHRGPLGLRACKANRDLRDYRAKPDRRGLLGRRVFKAKPVRRDYKVNRDLRAYRVKPGRRACKMCIRDRSMIYLQCCFTFYNGTVYTAAFREARYC